MENFDAKFSVKPLNSEKSYIRIVDGIVRHIRWHKEIFLQALEDLFKKCTEKGIPFPAELDILQVDNLSSLYQVK